MVLQGNRQSSVTVTVIAKDATIQFRIQDIHSFSKQ
ncbi:hypothetical protein LOK49_LG15G00804 [Camellia lanceoleosa]|uniref:Uncharacterized protein n=1 Tax=Camellia lanceoleosa TaxID=1840588 RepID=A0ACC0F3M9_9ERIC|nr:hypothetical protein LOK49_LG15G00804 [Camellia lanceoleosa]